MVKFLIYVVLISLLSSLTIAFIASCDESRFVDPDSSDYINLADNLVAGNGYSQNGESEIFRAPGYSFFIAPLRYCFPKTVLPIVILQAIIYAASIILLWYLTLQLTDNNIKIAKYAVIFQLLALSSLVFANKILTETLFTFLLLAFLLLLEFLIRQFNAIAMARVLYDKGAVKGGACQNCDDKNLKIGDSSGITSNLLVFDEDVQSRVLEDKMCSRGRPHYRGRCAAGDGHTTEEDVQPGTATLQKRMSRRGRPHYRGECAAGDGRTTEE